MADLRRLSGDGFAPGRGDEANANKEQWKHPVGGDQESG
jgi:hypothetical protein